MGRYRVVITDFISDDPVPEREVLGDLADVVALNAKNESEVDGKLGEADAVMMYHTLTVTSRTIDQMTRCKVIARGGVGYDNVDWAYARTKGIPVVNVPDYGTEEVADSAIALTLSLVRGTHLYSAKLQRGGPWSYTPAAPLTRLRGKVFGIVGLGRIGTAVARRALALGMDVAFFDPYREDGYDKALGIRRVETLPELLKQAFVVSLHCPLTPETRHMIGSAAMAMMPKGSYLVNTSRGGVVDTTAISAAIRNGQLAGAGIDVFAEEPPTDDHPLVKAWRDPDDRCYDRVIITPHAAFYSEEGLRDIRVKAATACKRALLGLTLRNVVN
ncbi:MAG TPA: C-terminal binding protein [Fimbriiglobus sp.]|jgi:D-3-phosphoglycerate dehydrogenase/C-terminal binding protein